MKWAELRDMTLDLKKGQVVGYDDDGNDVMGDIKTMHTVRLSDEDDSTWLKALSDLGYRPLPDTAVFDGEKIKFEVKCL